MRQVSRNGTNMASAVLARILSWGITTSARLLTAAQADWRGVDPMSDRQRIYFANHVSHGDFILVWSLLPAHQRHLARPVAGRDYWRKGPFRRFLADRVFNSVLIDRVPKSHGPNPIAQMEGALRTGVSLIVFPEGSRNLRDDDLMTFKSGLFRVACARPDVDLVPVWIDNLNRVLPKGALIPVPLMCRVVFGSPLHLHPDEDRHAFLTRARAALCALRPNAQDAA